MNNLVEKFKSEKRWVNWRFEMVKGKRTKVPYSVAGFKASSVNSKTWSTYDQVKAVSENVGIIFTPAQDVLGVDVDHVLIDGKLDNNHEHKEKIADFILEAETYCEISPGGDGLHFFFSITDAPLVLDANRHDPFEAYTSGRYFTVTEKIYGTTARDVRQITSAEALRLLEILGYPWKKEQKEILVSPEPGRDIETSKEDNRIPVALTDASLLNKMFASKTGDKIKALYDGDLSAHDNNNSQADMSLCSSLAFWTGKDPQQMERLWLASPLGAREKTQKRADYRTRTINAAIDICKEVYSIPKEVLDTRNMIDSLDLLYVINKEKEKVYIQNTENICRILLRHENFSDRLRYDEFRTLMEIRPIKTNVWRPLQDADLINIQTSLSILFPFLAKVGKDIVYDAIIKVSFEKVINSAQDYLKSLKWDKEYRLDSWLESAYGVKKNVYHTAVGANWLKGLVKRIMDPGCKFDYVLVLEGPQGCKKSSSLTALGGGLTGWHLETIASTDNKDFFMQFQGKAIIEFAEGETFSRTEVRRMKGIISMLSDKYRVPWGRVSQDFPRHCVFAMSTNESEYLKDDTGNRRWLPIRVVKPEADVQWIIDNRAQLLAEAYHRVFTKKETIYEFPKEETLSEQAQRQMEDPNTDATVDWYYNGKLSLDDKERGITAMMVYRDVWCGGYINKPMQKFQEMIIVNVLKNRLNLTKRRVMVDKVQSNRWYDDSNGIKVPKEMDPRNTKDTITADEIGNDAAWNL